MTDQVNDQLQQDEAADFAAAFAEVRDEPAPAASNPVVSEAKPNEQDQQAQEVAEDNQSQSEQEAVVMAGLTESQLKEILAKAAQTEALQQKIGALENHLQQYGQTIQKVTGKLGEFERFKQELAKQPKQQTLNLSQAKLDRLAKDYPDIAEALAQDLQSIPVGGGVDFNRDEFAEQLHNKFLSEAESRYATRLAEYEQKLAAQHLNTQKQMLTMAFGDWESTVRSPDFQMWTGILSPEESNLVRSTSDASVLASAIVQFKQWQEQTAKAKEAKQTRLVSAVQPSGVNRPISREPTTDLDDFMSEFNKVRGSHL